MSLTVYHKKFKTILGGFFLITNKNMFMNLKYKCYQKSVKMFNQNIKKLFNLNQCVSFIVSDIFYGFTIQNIEDLLV